MELRVAICDDEIFLLPELTAMIESSFRQHDLSIRPQTFSSSAELLRAVRSGNAFDCYFLDIDIPEFDGIMLAKKLRDAQPETRIIYVSAKDERVFETFRTRPLAFVRKSHFREELGAAISALAAQLQARRDTIVQITDELGHAIPLNINRIVYVEANQKYQKIVRVDGSELLRCTIDDLERLLAQHQFVRIHRSYLVNLRFVYRIDDRQILLDDKTALPMSRYRCKDVQQAFMQAQRVAQ